MLRCTDVYNKYLIKNKDIKKRRDKRMIQTIRTRFDYHQLHPINNWRINASRIHRDISIRTKK